MPGRYFLMVCGLASERRQMPSLCRGAACLDSDEEPRVSLQEDGQRWMWEETPLLLTLENAVCPRTVGIWVNNTNVSHVGDNL